MIAQEPFDFLFNVFLYWLLGTSVRGIGILRTTEQACLPQLVRGEYNKQGSFCLSSTRPFSRRRGSIRAVCITSIKQRVCFNFHALQERFLRWMKPPTTSLVLSTLADLTRGKSELLAENALLRHQLIILRRQIKRPTYQKTDRLLLVLLARMVRTWKQALYLVQPETILRWHRELFRISGSTNPRGVRRKPRLSSETIALIKKMIANNRLFGAERIRGELLKLDIRVSKRTISEVYAPGSPNTRRWPDLENLPAQSCKRRLGL